MELHDAILASIPRLEDRLARAGVDQWLAAQPTVTVEGRRYFVLGGDRMAGEAEAKLFFAFQRGLVSDVEVSRAAADADSSLPPDVEAVDIKTDEPGDS